MLLNIISNVQGCDARGDAICAYARLI